jgi:transcriptional regulator with XRE-family HTH domain
MPVLQSGWLGKADSFAVHSVLNRERSQPFYAVFVFTFFIDALSVPEKRKPKRWFEVDQGEIARVLKGARMAAGLSLREVADLSNVSPSHLLRIESGEFNYSTENFALVTQSLGLRAGDVIEAAMKFTFERRRPLLKSLETVLKYPEIRHPEKFEEIVDQLWDLAVRILWAANPLARAKERPYPTEALAEAFRKYAVFVEQLSAEERRVTMAAFEERPIPKLQSLHLVPPDEQLPGFVKQVAGWDFKTSFPNLSRSKA